MIPMGDQLQLEKGGGMSILSFTLHYRIRRFVNKVLWRTVRRRHKRELSSVRGIVAHLNYSKAAIEFSYRQVGEQILYKVSDLAEGSVVMDVGGDRGDLAMELYRRYRPKLYIFEPHPESVKILQERFGDFGSKILPYGLGSSDQRCELSDDGMGSSIYDASANYVQVKKFEIEIRDVKTVMDELTLEDVDLLKVNIEGGEYDLLSRLIDSNFINRFRVIRIQFHDWFPNAFALRKKIVKELSKSHDVEWSYPMVWESWVRRGPCR